MRANVAGPSWQRAGAIMMAGATTNFLDLGPSALWTWCGSGSFVTFHLSFFASLSITSAALPWSSNHALNLFCFITTSTCQKRCSLILIRFEQGWGSGKWMRIHIHKTSYNPAVEAKNSKQGWKRFSWWWGVKTNLKLNVSLLLTKPQVGQRIDDKAVEVELHVVVLQVFPHLPQ